MPEEISLRLMSHSDCDDIYSWRCDPLTHSLSLSKRFPTIHDHQAWFRRALVDNNRLVLIGLVNGIKIGMCRFDTDAVNNLSEVSINLDPNFRGLGYGKRFLALCIVHYSKIHKHCLIAKIKPNNASSTRIFSLSNFRSTSDCNDFLILKRGPSSLLFKEVDNGDIDTLFELLKMRSHSISHAKLPTIPEHTDFVKNNPYRYWALIYQSGLPIGTFYIQKDNSVGFYILEPSKMIVQCLLKYISHNYKPYSGIKSVVPPYFYVNVPHGDKKLINILHETNATPIQLSYKF